MDRQTLHYSVHRFNASGPESLIDSWRAIRRAQQNDGCGADTVEKVEFSAPILAAMDRLWRNSFGGIYDTH
jgi:hypothetical protein